MKQHNFKLSILTLTVLSLLITTASSLAETATNIHMKLVTFDQVLFDDNLTVSPCLNNNEGGELTVNAWCAVEQLSLSRGWTASSTWYAYGLMLNSINQYNGADGNYWLWYSNNEPGMTSLNGHILTDNENLLLTYGINPLKIIASTTTPDVDSTSTLSAWYFDTNAWGWQSAADCDFVINGATATSTGSSYDLLVSTTTPYVITAKKSGWLDSPAITLTGIAKSETATTSPDTQNETATSTPDTQNQPASSGGGGYFVTPVNFDVDKAVNFLSANQNSDGSIGASIIFSDWSAIALSAYGDSQAKNKLKEYLQTSGYSTDSAVGVTDLDRRAMALMALGVSPYDGTNVNYIAKIVVTFDGQQIGNSTIFNDDIFSLIVLLKAGFKSPEPIVDKTIQFIINAQSADGSWGSVDLTAAGIQALALAEANGNLDASQIVAVNQSLLSAKDWLKQAEQADASFNQNVFSTAWAVQAISALKEPLADWTKNNQTPLNFLGTNQMSDGGLESQSTDISTRLWATAYAVPAGLNKSWGDILNNFSKPILPAPLEEIIIKPMASSTLEITEATSTQDISSDKVKATSTPDGKITEANDVLTEKVEAGNLEQSNLAKAQTGLIVKPASQPTARRTAAKKSVAPVVEAPTQVLGNKVVAAATPDTQNIPSSPLAVKLIFYVAGGASIALGAYLGWKFLFKKF